ncbi:MAG: response regulator [Phycisphaerae bacterium]
MTDKDVFTTGQVAKLCNVAPRTVSKWFDSGQLRGYRIPGSRDRRIPKAQLVRFMQAHEIPIDGLETGQSRMIVVDHDRDLTRVLKEALEKDGLYKVDVAASAFEAGVMMGQEPANLMLVDVSLPDVVPVELVRTLRTYEQLQLVRLLATSGGLSAGQGQSLVQQGFAAFIAKPFEIRELLSAMENSAAQD